MKLYIKNTACISSLEVVPSKKGFELRKPEQNDSKKSYVIEPNYKDLLSFNIIRRSARYVKLGLFTALQCLKDSNKELEGIMVGTGVGSFSYTEKFIMEMNTKKEEMLSPNLFLQSMSSLLSGYISILTKCNGYNVTYVNRGISFENALMDARSHFTENNDGPYLVGAADEITDNYAHIVEKTGYLQTKQNQEQCHGLGEGAAFMLVSANGNDGDIAISGIKMLFEASPEEIDTSISDILEENQLQEDDIDLILTTKAIQNYLKLAQKTPCLFYKEHIGEFPTATAFAVWLSEKILSTQHIPSLFNIGTLDGKELKRILIVNEYRDNASILLISA